MRTTITSYLEDFFSRGDETAFAHRQGLRIKKWSYADVAQTALRFARELEGRAIQEGDRILIWARNSPEWVASFFGCALRGAVAVPLDLQSEAGFVQKVQNQVQSKLAFCDSSTSPLIEQSLPVIDLDQMQSVTEQNSDKPYKIREYNPDHLVEIIFTSGTTAEPKGVCITHRNLLANLNPLQREIERYRKWERLVHPIRFLNLLPLSHVFGQFMGMFVPPLLAGEVFFQESLIPSQIIETVKRERINVIACVPRLLETLREKIERDYEAQGRQEHFKAELEAAATSSVVARWWKFRQIHQMFGWKFWAFISGGATVNADIEEFWRRLGFAVIQGYGMTETAALISVNHPFRAGRGSIGKQMPGVEVKLSASGEILVRGDNVSPGYWKEGGEVFAASDGWFRTGDVGQIDAKGNLYFRGRQKDVIITSSGQNIYPEDLELVLNRQPEVQTSTVLEVQGPNGPEPAAVLILRGDCVAANHVIQRANEALAPYQQIRRWVIWPEQDFPRTHTQKVRKQLVAERLNPTFNREVASNLATSDPLKKIFSRVGAEIGQTLDASAKLGTDYKLDSLGRVELLSALEDTYQIQLDEASFTEATTVGDIERMVREGKQEAAADYPYPRWQQRWPINWLRLALLYPVVFPLTRIMARPTIKGKSALRSATGQLVFVCNHITMVDHALILLALPRRYARRMAIAMDGELLREWRHPGPNTPFLTRFVHLAQYLLVVLFFNVFSMPQKSGFRRSFVFAGELMDRGYSILVFPEGRRTQDGQMHHFLAGTGLLISKLNARVVPMRIDGLWKLRQAGKHTARKDEVSVIIGEPTTYSAGDDPQDIAADLEARVKTLSSGLP